MWKSLRLVFYLGALLLILHGSEALSHASLWDEMLTEMMSHKETRVCGNECYVVINGKQHYFQGESYVHPSAPCMQYACKQSEDIEKIVCSNTPTDCELIYRVGQCCPVCNRSNIPEPKLTPWSKWTECSKKCGGGLQERTRTCIIPDGARDVGECGEKTLRKNRTCNTHKCPTKCVWKKWSDWSSCSVTCGIGTEERTREPISATYSGPNCEGKSSETQLCYRQKCQNSQCPNTHSVCYGLCIPDMDHDCFDDTIDNCPQIHNTDQLDYDGDTFGNACDNCKNLENFDQSDNDNDGRGDECDNDSDNDGIIDRFDNCRFIANYRQLQIEVDQYGAICNISGNGIIIEYDVVTAEDKQSMIAEMMQMMYQLLSAN